MNEITEKQIATIKGLSRRAKIEVKNVEGLSKFEASKVIEGLLQKVNPKQEKKDYSRDALAGLAVKILAQRSEVDDMVDNARIFSDRVVALYRVFRSARQACLA